jgi:transposase-like protein
VADTPAKRKRRKSGQPFSISTAARTFNPRDISRLTEEEAYAYFVEIRFKENDGKAQCPHCGCGACYEYNARRIYKCMNCEKQFSATTKTEWSGRKLSFRQILELIVEFALPAKGISAIQISKNLGISYRTAFYRLHDLRGAMQRSHEDTVFDTPVEIDGAEFGGYIRPKNLRIEPKDHGRFPYRSPKKQVVGVIREQRPNGRTRVVIGRTEHEAAKLMPQFIKPGTRIYADLGSAFNFMSHHYSMRRIKHSVEFWRPGISTNNAECFFSVLRRAERGTYHHIASRYFKGYANEVAWRQDRRRTDTKTVFEDLCALAIVPFERRSAPSIDPVVQEIQKPFRAFDFTPTTKLQRSIKVRSAQFQTGELASTMLTALGQRRRAAMAKRAEAKSESKIGDLNREIRKLDKGIEAIIVRKNRLAQKSHK